MAYTKNGRFLDKLYDHDGQSDTYNYNSKTGYLDSVNDLFFAEHYLVPSQASNTASKIHEWSQKVTIYDGVTTKLTKKVVVNSSIKANAPVLTCRACGRPIGKQYSWQCRSGWTY